MDASYSIQFRSNAYSMNFVSQSCAHSHILFSVQWQWWLKHAKRFNLTRNRKCVLCHKSNGSHWLILSKHYIKYFFSSIHYQYFTKKMYFCLRLTMIKNAIYRFLIVVCSISEKIFLLCVGALCIVHRYRKISQFIPLSSFYWLRFDIWAHKTLSIAFLSTVERKIELPFFINCVCSINFQMLLAGVFQSEANWIGSECLQQQTDRRNVNIHEFSHFGGANFVTIKARNKIKTLLMTSLRNVWSTAELNAENTQSVNDWTSVNDINDRTKL